MENISVADALALMGKNDGDAPFSSGWWIILLFLFFLGFGGNGIFGTGGAGNIQLTNLERDVLTGNCATQKEILESRYTTQLGFQNIASEMASCCCELKTAIHSEGEATRALITQNTIQELRDEVAGYRDTLSNANQTQNLLNILGVWYSKPSINPAYAYGAFGCNNSAYACSI